MSAPTVQVLLATRNGREWLPEQLADILGQTGVSVSVLALDDESTDGTHEWLLEQAATEPRLRVLPRQGASGSAAANFYRLLAAADIDAADFLAFADQDDRWAPDKLSRQVAVLADSAVAGRTIDGTSSNVTAFDADGRRWLIKKDYPQRQFDYLLESPGPGCTFMLTPRLARLCQDQLAAADGVAAGTDFHDWLIYAICRGAGLTWHIDGECAVEYRQHAANTFGANSGLRSRLSRLKLLNNGWHRGQATKMAEVALAVAPAQQRAELTTMLDLLRRTGPVARLKLAARAGRLRRRPRDRVVIAAMVVLGVW